MISNGISKHLHTNHTEFVFINFITAGLLYKLQHRNLKFIELSTAYSCMKWSSLAAEYQDVSSTLEAAGSSERAVHIYEATWRQISEPKTSNQGKVGRTLACVKTCNSQDTMSATWRQHHDSDRCAAVFIISFVSTVLLSLRHVADITSRHSSHRKHPVSNSNSTRTIAYVFVESGTCLLSCCPETVAA
jgi:hypothetical protein